LAQVSQIKRLSGQKEVFSAAPPAFARKIIPMDTIDSNELWRFIPPEEKVQALTKAQSKGVAASLMAIAVAGTLSVGLQEVWVFYGALIISPLIYQLAAGRSWRELKPKMMLEYLAARSAARRYAFSVKGEELTVKLMFRGTLIEEFKKDELNQALEDSVFGNREAAVWISLFPDSVILMQEHPGGAMLRFGHLINDKLEVSSNSDGYDNDLEVTLSSNDPRRGLEKRFKIKSDSPAALTVFLKRLEEFKAKQRESFAKRSLPLPSKSFDEDDDFVSNF
jgi:Arc/MetJ family transcription regulator